MRARWSVRSRAWVVALGLLALAGCATGGGLVNDDATGSGYCAQQAATGPVLIGLSTLRNEGTSVAEVTDVTLIDPTDGIELVGAYLVPEADTPSNGQPFVMPDDPVMTVEPGGTVFVVVGIGLRSGVHAARADGVRVTYRVDGRESHVRTRLWMQTSEAGAPCDADWTPPGSDD
ncbi:hypothetical protein [Cellulomonas composti]|uniref:Lipoprotein n=1 Tax=Cellulomonas composti TaxID=266130 RepID=A0A511JCH9_9CELL|nr:hypothetical protein [Cellulomonas composti]GEL95413.1 hypothetical protein CCO02nite_20710 [Cellulomonas composti]